MSGIPTTGAVSMTALNTNFSGGNSLSGYRNKTIYDSSTNEATTIAASGAISFSTFRGKRALAPPVATANTPTISGGVLTYSWSATNSPASYTVNFYRTTSNTLGIGTLLVTLTNTTLTSSTYTPVRYTFFNSSGGPIYRFTVTATNAAGTSPLVQSSDVQYDPPVATAGVLIAGGVLTYSWSATNTPTSFAVSLTNTTTNTIVAGFTSYTNEGSATYSPLTNEQTYLCSVTATNSQGSSPEKLASITYSVLAPIVNTPTISGGVLSYSALPRFISGQTIISTQIKLYDGNNTLLATNGGGSYTPVAGNSYYITASTTTNVGISLLATSGSVTYNPPVATANTPTFSSPAYTQLINGATFPATGTPITLINTGTVGWYNLMISYTISGAVTYFTTGMSSGQSVSVAAGSMYTGFSIPANVTSFSVRPTDTNFNQALQQFTKSSGGLVDFLNPNSSWAVNSIISVSTGGPLMTYTWSGTNSPTSYIVNLYQSNGTVLATLTNTTTTSANYLPVGGTTYYTTVRATNAQATSALVTSGSVAYNPPVATANTPTISGGVLTYSWSGTNSPTSYAVNLYRSGSATALATQTSGTSATFNSLTSGFVYSITVTATNAQGTSALATSGTVTYNPPVVTVNTPTITLGSILVCTWSATNSPTSYTVQQFTTPWTTAAYTITTTATTASFRLSSGYTGTFRVTATNSQGTSAAVTSATSPQADSAFRILFDASYLASVTGTSPVTAWRNEGIAFTSATQSSGSASYVTDSQSGLNIIKFGPGVEMRFTVALPNQARAWFIVAKNTTQLVSSGSGQYWALINQTVGNGQDSLGGPSYASGNYDMGEGPSGIRVNINGSTYTNPYNVWKCYTWINSATNRDNNFIGVNKVSITLTTSIAASSYRTDSIAYSINTASYGTGSDIAEIICYNNEISSIQRNIIIDYLMAKWKIT